MDAERIHPMNIGTRFTQTGNILQGLPNQNQIMTQILAENISTIGPNSEEISYIIRSELLPPLAAGSETNKPIGGDRMDEGTRMILERLERDSREREERYHTDSQERERRIRDESKEREDRIVKVINDLKEEIKEDFRSFETKLDKMETKIDGTYKHISALALTTIVAIVAIVISVWIK